MTSFEARQQPNGRWSVVEVARGRVTDVPIENLSIDEAMVVVDYLNGLETGVPRNTDRVTRTYRRPDPNSDSLERIDNDEANDEEGRSS